MGQVRGVAADELLGLVDGSDGLDLASFSARLKATRKRPQDFLNRPAVLPLPLLGLAACGGGAASAPPPAPAPTVVAPTIAPVAPPAVAPGTTTATGNVLPTTNQSGAAAATISAVSLPGGASGTVGSALATPLGDFTLRSDGSYSFVVANNDAVKSLPNGVTQDITINFTAGNSGGNTSSSIKLTITGINDAPVATNDSITAPVVITGPITGNVLGNDSDIDRGTTLSVTAITAQAAQVGASLSGTQSGNATLSAVGTFGSISINSDGSYSYTLDKNDADFIALRGGQTATEAFEYSVSDGAGGTAKAVLNIVVTGVNDAPTVSNASGNVTEDAAINITTGTITIADPDTSQSVSIASVNGTAFVGTSTSFNGTYGNLLLNSSGTWTYTLDNARTATNALAQNAAATESFTVTARDAVGTTATGIITVNVTGANDAPTVSNASGAVTEDATANTTTGTLAVSDIDNGQTASIASVNGAAFTGTFTSFTGTYGTLGLNSSGAWTYTLDNARAATQNLAGGQQVTETFAVTARDPLAATGTGNIVVTVTGAADGLSVPAGVTLSARIFDTIALNVPLPIGDGTINARIMELPSAGVVRLSTGEAIILNQLLSLSQVAQLKFDSPSSSIGNVGNLKINYSKDGGSEISQTNLLSVVSGSQDIVGTSGADTVEAILSDRRYFGLNGDDVFNFRSTSAITLVGGNGNDTAIIRHDTITEIFTIDLANALQAPAASYADIYFYSIENLTAFDSTKAKFLGNSSSNILTGSSNDDYLDGRGGNDIIIGGRGNNRLIGGAGDDQINATSAVGSISVDFILPGAGTDVVTGDVYDTVSYEDSLQAVNYSLAGAFVATGDAAGDVLNGITRLTGTDFNDRLGGNSSVNIIHGLGGNDLIEANIGGGEFFGDTGNDTLIGGNGRDYLYGGADSDALSGGRDGDVIDGGAGDDYISDSQIYRSGMIFSQSLLSDTINLGFGSLIGGDGNDRIIGSQATGSIEGGTGDDLIVASFSSALSLQISGGAGNDKIVLLDGALALVNGDTGNDIFILDTALNTNNRPGSGYYFYAGISGFERGVDKIDLTDLRDASGNILDLQDILDHSTSYTDAVSGASTRIDLSEFTSSLGLPIEGFLDLRGFSSSAPLGVSDFIFTGGEDWLITLGSGSA
jgi:VCBS repeat-containing protein